MKDKLKRKSNDESNKMLRNPDEIYKKTIQILKKKYGYTSKQIVSEFTIPQDFESLRVDLAVFSKDDDKNPKIIGEIKIGKFVFPFAEYQLEKYMKASNTKYGFLTNGKEWINYQLRNNKIHRIGDIPTSKELKLILSGKKSDKKFVLMGDANYILKKLSHSIWKNGLMSTEILPQLISLKLYDENFEKNKNFEKIVNYPETYLEVFQTLWSKFDKKFPNTFSSFQLSKEYTHNILSEIIEFSNFSLMKSNPSEISKFLIDYIYDRGIIKGGYFGTPKELIEFLYDLLELSKKDSIVVPYSGPETLVYLLDLLNTTQKTSNENIVTIEPIHEKTKILHIISQLNLPKFQIFRHDPVSSPMLEEFRAFDHVIAFPPFGKRFEISKSDNFPEMNLGTYGNESIHYFVKRLITSFNKGTKISLLVPQGFLFNSNSSYKKIRKEILETCTIHGIIQLPQGFFKTTGVQTSLLLLEIGVSHKDKYDVFMSVYPKPLKSFGHSNKEVIKNIIDDFHNFQKGNSIEEPNQNRFVVGINEIIENGWTVTNKIPEFKEMLDISDKQNISDVVEIIQGTNIPSKNASEGKKLPFIRISDIENNTIKSKVGSYIALDDDSILKYKKYLIKEGDILLSSKGTTGKVAIVEKKYEGAIASSQLFILRSNTKLILPDYLLDCLNSKIVKKQISGIVRGDIIAFLPKSEFSKIIISVPSLSEQEGKISESMKLQNEISELEKILSQKRHKLQEYRDNE